MTKLSVQALLLTGALAALPVGGAYAQSDNEQEAARRFALGVELYREGSLDAALVEFERAYELVPSYRLLFNLAQVQAERHEYVAAIELFERYLAEGGEEIGQERRSNVRREMQQLRARVAELWVETNVEGAELFVNDRPIGKLPLSKRLLINSGIHEVKVEKPGYVPARQTLRVAGGDQARLALPLVPSAQEQAAGPGAVHRAVHDDREVGHLRPNWTPFWVSAVVTGVLGASTATFLILAQKGDSDLDAELNRFPANLEAIERTRDRTRVFAALTDGSGVATAVAAGFTLYYLADALGGTDERPGRLAAGALRVVPHLNGAAFVGAF